MYLYNKTYNIRRNIKLDSSLIGLLKFVNDQEYHTLIHLNRKGKVNFGLAHGVPSFLSLLINLHKRNKRININLIVDISKYIYQQRRDLCFSKYPSFLGDESEFAESKLAWCYGDLGVNMSLLKFSRYIGDNSLQSKVIEDLVSTTNRIEFSDTRIVDCSLCHGAAGALYIYKYLYKIYNIAEFNVASNYWENFILDRYRKNGIEGLKTDKGLQGHRLMSGVLDGLSGILLALFSEEFNCQPFNYIFLIDI